MMRFGMCAAATLVVMACATGGAAPEGGPRNVGTTTTSPLSGIRGGGVPGAGGASSAGSHPMSVSMTTSADLGALNVVPGTVDSVYNALAKGYLSLGVDVLTRDPQAHVLGNRKIVVMHELLHRPLSAFFNCGIDPVMGRDRADTYRLTASVLSTLSPDAAGKTRVVTLVTAEANDLATSASSVYCSSTGLMERTILKASGYQPD